MAQAVVSLTTPNIEEDLQERGGQGAPPADARLVALDREHARLKATFDAFEEVDDQADAVGKELEHVEDEALETIEATSIEGLAAKARIVCRRGARCWCHDDNVPLAEAVLALIGAQLDGR